MPKIYKYFAHDALELIFQRDGYCGIKCSLPKDYNDPYELFLGVDLSVPPDCLASYKDLIDEIPQLPTTCFSKSPIVSPMWAHYAKEHTGFVLEFDTEKLETCLTGCLIRDVTYREKPNEKLEDLLFKLSRIGKFRYAAWLLQAAFNSAYFSKYTDWSYEQETRLIDLEQLSEDINNNKILFIPSSCITSIIIGNKFPAEKINLSIKKSVEHNLKWHSLKIGKSYPVPYLNDQSEEAFIFKNSNIVPSEYVCTSCSEPLSQEGDLCPWCSITQAHKIEAAITNPFRILDHYGQLDNYLISVSDIEKNKT